MRRQRQIKKITIIFLVAAICIISFKVCVFYKQRRVPPAVEGGGALEVVKSFSFSSGQDLKEWDEKVLSRNGTDYQIAALEGENKVRAVSEDSASALYYKQRLFYKKSPFLSWDWKAEKFPLRREKEVLDKKSEFDFVAQVYVVFHSQFILHAKAIQYVWTESIPKGTIAASPYTKNVKVMVLESGESAEWRHELRNIREDFLHLFGEELTRDIDAIAFMTDSDSTNSSAIAYYDNIEIGYIEKPQEYLPEKVPEKEGEEPAKPVEEVKEEPAPGPEPERPVEAKEAAASAEPVEEVTEAVEPEKPGEEAIPEPEKPVEENKTEVVEEEKAEAVQVE